MRPARGSVELLVIDAVSGRRLNTWAVGPRSNALARDLGRQRVLAADVQTSDARLYSIL
jgi:hypothetical protein